MPRGGRTRTSGQGRQKGVPNAISRDIKEMVVGALCAVGGTNYLARQAEQNPVAFMGLIGRILPLQVTGENGGALLVDFRWADAPVANATNAVADETKPTTVTIEAEDAEVVWSDGNEC